ncbi:MAG: metal-binding protein [Clostridia bacterium]
MDKFYKLISAENKQYLSKEKGIYGGYKPLKIYGKLDCPSALRWIEKGYYVGNRVFFASEYDAVMAGYRPCAVCQKEKYLLWKEDKEKFKNSIIKQKKDDFCQ